MAKKTSTKKRTSRGRTSPMVPKAGVTATHRRYGGGGKVKKTK